VSTVATRPRSSASGIRVKPRALVLRAPGTNCDRETARALEMAGADVESRHLDALLGGNGSLDDFALLVLPGGFSFGDHLGAGTLWAHRLDALAAPLDRFVTSGRPVLGICNGFQALLRLGLLTGGSLAPNASGRFECRWVWLQRPANAGSALLAGIDRIPLPVANGEGRFVASDAATLAALRGNGQVALVYSDADGMPDGYPSNPSGAEGDVAALTNETGNVLGLMPHPERNVSAAQAPAGRQGAAGLAIFRNAVRMAKG
jgi:phosphoribosylformylglycinamidine synthase I